MLLFFIIASTILQAYGTYMQGKQAEDTAEYNARVAEQQAKAAEQKAAYEAEQRRKEGRKLKSRQIAAAGASGATIESFDPLFEETVRDTELDVLAIQYGANIASLQKKQEAAGLRMQGKQAYRSGLISTGSSLLSGGAKIIKYMGSPG